MKWNRLGAVIIASLVLVLVSAYGIECKSYANYKLISVSNADVDKYRKLEEQWASTVDFMDDVFEASSDFRIVLHNDRETEFTKYLIENGFESKVLHENVETLIENERKLNAEKRQAHKNSSRSSARDFVMDNFWNYEEIMEYVDTVGKEFDSIVTVHRLKDSLQSRRIVNIEITAPGDSEERPIIFIDSTIHAREWAAPMVIMHLIRELTENFEQHEEMLELVRFFIVPLVNPDGYHFTHTEDRLWRKNMRGYTGEENVCWGVDCNRNYDHRWEDGETENICSEIYAGTSAFSEVEAQNIRDIVDENIPTIILYISTHTYGSFLLYPFSSSTSTLPENHEEQEYVGRVFARTVKEHFGTEYKVGNGANLLSVGYGTSKDWVYPKVRLSYTLELPRGDGNTGFEISFDKIEDLAKETVDGFIELANFVADNYDFTDWK